MTTPRQQPDPAGSIISSGRDHRRIYLGRVGANEPYYAEAESPILALGPSGSGKTAGLIIPALLSTTGAVVGISSRDDLYTCSALFRARFGPVYSLLSPDLPGATEIRFSPLQGRDKWDYAHQFGRRWVSYPDVSAAGISHDAKGQAHFRLWAGVLTSALAYFAATHDKDIEWLIGALAGSDADRSKIQKQLQAMPGTDALKAAQALSSVRATFDAEQSGILSTAILAMSPYLNDSALRSQRNADFDFDAFMKGNPDDRSAVQIPPREGLEHIVRPLRGRWASVYGTSGDAEDQRTPILLEFLYRARKAAYAAARRAELSGSPAPEPMTVVLDELAASPIPDASQVLAESRGRSLQVIGGLQSLSQANRVYGRDHDFLSLWRTTVVFRGSKDMETLNLLSTLAGTYWQEMTSSSEKPEGGYTGNISYTEREQITKSEIAHGHKDRPDAALVIDPRAKMFYADIRPYYREPWRSILLDSAERAYADGLTRFPLPPLQFDEPALADRWQRLKAMERN